MRNRGSAVLIEDNKVALIKRIKVDCVYYVFPGGGIEEGETPEEATKREAFEELGVQIFIKKEFSKIEFNGTQYFYLADIIDGVFGTGQAKEFLRNESNLGTYHPMWIEINNLPQIDVRPKEIAEKILTLVY
ncbi:MAG: NUDIX domain-containing protein [Paenisporosarcina sp.]